MRGESNPGDDPNKIICKYTTGAESSYEPKCLQTGLYWNKYVAYSNMLKPSNQIALG